MLVVPHRGHRDRGDQRLLSFMDAVMTFGWLTAPFLYGSMSLNWLCGGPFHETASARMAYAREHGNHAAIVGCKILNILDLKTSLGPVDDHCRQAIIDDTKRRHLEP